MGVLKNACFWSRGTIRRSQQSSRSTSYQGESDRLKKEMSIFQQTPDARPTSVIAISAEKDSSCDVRREAGEVA